MREKLEDATRGLEESRNSVDKLKREGQMRSEKDRLQIGELLEVSRLRSQLEEMMSKLDGNKTNLTDQISREKEAKFDMVSSKTCLQETLENLMRVQP